MQFLYRVSQRGKQKDDSIQPRSYVEPHSHVNEPTILVSVLIFPSVT